MHYGNLTLKQLAFRFFTFEAKEAALFIILSVKVTMVEGDTCLRLLGPGWVSLSSQRLLSNLLLELVFNLLIDLALSGLLQDTKLLSHPHRLPIRIIIPIGLASTISRHVDVLLASRVIIGGRSALLNWVLGFFLLGVADLAPPRVRTVLPTLEGSLPQKEEVKEFFPKEAAIFAR